MGVGKIEFTVLLDEGGQGCVNGLAGVMVVYQTAGLGGAVLLEDELLIKFTFID